MLELCRKKSMARNLSKMYKLFPEHYDFMPRTFSLPIDMQVSFQAIRASLCVGREAYPSAFYCA